jgi:membrane-bound lytic murein transglycosylase D
MPLVESAFKSNALSRASARGMWQFMLGTGREHGLDQDWFIDERSDPEKATRAAAVYLKTLSDMWDGDWYFAMASYNAGPGRLQRAVKLSKKSDYWAVTASTKYLPRETREYVPMMLAAMIIAKNPILYGFEIGPAMPITFETVVVPDALALSTIAEWASITVADIQALNPELRRTVTPMGEHPLKVPVGTAPMIQKRLDTTNPEFLKYTIHTVKRGETIKTIAKKYNVNERALRDYNDLSARVVKPQLGSELAIPPRSAAGLPSATATRPAVTASNSAKPPASTAKPPAPTTTAPLTYRVRAGDTLYSIARQFGLTVDALKRLNQIAGDKITVGDRLTIRR